MLLEKTRAGSKPVRLAGISVSNLSEPASTYQQNLFYNAEKLLKNKELNKAVDEINRKFGNKTINPATLLRKKHNES